MVQDQDMTAAVAAAEQAWRSGQIPEAIAQARAAVKLAPEQAEPYRWLGNGLQSLERWAAADRAYRRAIARRPDWAEVWANRAALAYKQGDWVQAVDRYEQAIALDPTLPEVHVLLAQALCQQGRWHEAARVVAVAVEQSPDQAMAHLLQSWIALDRQDYNLALAEQAARRSLDLDPNYPGAWFQWGRVCFYREEFQEAIAAHRQGLALAPADAGVTARALGAIGNCHFELTELDAAAACYEEALRHQPDEADTRWGHANLLLHRGDYGQGFAEFEWRWPRVLPRRPFAQPAWNGEPIEGQTILVYAQCGLGDILNLARYLPLLAERGARVVVESPQTTARLLAAMPSVARVLLQGEALPPFDWQISFLSLPKVFTPSLAAIPKQIPYLSSRAGHWQPEADRPFDRSQLQVGLAWASGRQTGRDGNRDYRNRSIPLADLLTAVDLPGVQLHGLQVGEDAAAIEAFPQVWDWRDRLKDFADTAALVAQLDLVICVDTSVTHVAGGLGQLTWVLLPHMPNWRWMLDRTDCLWYPTMRLFRQPQPKDWAALLPTVRSALQQVVSDRSLLWPLV